MTSNNAQEEEFAAAERRVKEKAEKDERARKEVEQAGSSADPLLPKNNKALYGVLAVVVLAVLYSVLAAWMHERQVTDKTANALTSMFYDNYRVDGNWRMCSQSCDLVNQESLFITELKSKYNKLMDLHEKGGEFDGVHYLGMETLRKAAEKASGRVLALRDEPYKMGGLDTIARHALVAKNTWLYYEEKAKNCRDGVKMTPCADYEERKMAVICSRLVATSLEKGACYFGHEADTISLVEDFMKKTEDPFGVCWKFWEKEFPNSAVHEVKELRKLRTTWNRPEEAECPQKTQAA